MVIVVTLTEPHRADIVNVMNRVPDWVATIAAGVAIAAVTVIAAVVIVPKLAAGQPDRPTILPTRIDNTTTTTVEA